jgi:ketosteroid isomerase-like protein
MVRTATPKGDRAMYASKVLALVVIMFGCLATCMSLVSVAADTDDEAVIRAGSGSWPVAHNAGDIDKMVALYADDAVLLPPDAPAVTGRAAIREFLTKDVAASKAAGIRIKDLKSSAGVSGNLGWHAGHFAVVDGAGKTVGTGKYSEVWRKTDGKWVMIRDMWNNDAPAAPMK